jgi:Reverse transcriptase (RNA-dependent DNA polymerase)
MNDIFQDMADVFVVVYLDDILIFSKKRHDHHKHVRMVLTRLREHNLFVKPEKCLFHSDWVEFLGFIISPAGVAMDTEKTATISKWPGPTNLRDVQSFSDSRTSTEDLSSHFRRSYFHSLI